VYRKSCEVALRLFRNKAEALLGVLKPFIYDPVSEWHGKGMRLCMRPVCVWQPRFYVVYVYDRGRRVRFDHVAPPEMIFPVQWLLSLLQTKAR
jgi:hypothetical protein